MRQPEKPMTSAHNTGLEKLTLARLPYDSLMCLFAMLSL
jgi:hypothetical protein